MKLIFVHGWSVNNLNTYGILPEVLAKRAPDAGLDIEVEHIWLGEYISFHDEVRIPDIVVAFQHAIGHVVDDGEEFSCITHSTGGPVIREWVNTYFGKDRIDELPLKHLIMLAPANHGSALAQLGKQRVGRIRSWFEGVEPGQGILDWLELGSSGQWALNSDWLQYPPVESFFPFVITGQTIDKKFYDYLNSYTGEKGTDGVVRVTGANLNYRKVSLKQDSNSEFEFSTPDGTKGKAAELVITAPPELPATRCALEVLPNASHTQKNIGIIDSITKRNQNNKQVVRSILDCLQVGSAVQYALVSAQMQTRTQIVQTKGDEYSMVVFKVVDTHGKPVTDFDLYLLAGEDYQPDKLPRGFFIDKQKNKVNQNHLTYYFNHSKLTKASHLGFRIVARPDEGFAFFKPAEFRSDMANFSQLLIANQTLMVEVTLQRRVAENTFLLVDAEASSELRQKEKARKRLTKEEEKQLSFKKRKPSDETLLGD